jgi:hypothetical protein
MSIKLFQDDNDYLEWMIANPSSFVVNIISTKNPKKLVLHETNCTHITSNVRFGDGVFTERKNTKIGIDDIAEVKDLVQTKYPQFKGEVTICRSCNPS